MREPNDFYIGCRVRHLGTQKVRTVSGIRRGEGNTILHFSQVIKKHNGRTFYWSDTNHVRLLK